MVRQRKYSNLQHKHSNNSDSNSSSNSSESNFATRYFKTLSIWKTCVGIVCLLIAIYIGTLGYLETRVNTPLDTPKVVQESGLEIPERYWGSYRPGVYFGMKSRSPQSPVFGLMWYDASPNSRKGIRHWCDQNDNLPTYGWLRHDGISFGEQAIYDPPYTIFTSFVKTPGGKLGGQWTARVNVTAKRDPRRVTLVWYAALEDTGGPEPERESRVWLDGGAIVGYTPELTKFRVTMVPHRGNLLHTSSAEAHAPGLHLLKEKYYSLLKIRKTQAAGPIPVVGADPELEDVDKEVNFTPVQMLVETPFVLDIVYTADMTSAAPLEGDAYTAALEAKKLKFDNEFEHKFGLADKGYAEEDVAVAKAAMSNMVGGVGYFFGAGRVQSEYTKEPVPYWKTPLYTGVPSRSFFPRGFLWDEGFHGLLIGRWSLDIQMDIASHWLDLINIEGWIPREQILGAEALARVPKEFVVQSNDAANPPMLLLQIARLVKRNPRAFDANMPHRKTLERMYSKLKVWFNWFQSTQSGVEYTAFRWRGRVDDGVQINPKTLTSGLDDFPRASHPSEIERHVDLRCWMYAAAESLAVIAKAIGKKPHKYEEIRKQLGDEELLNKLHWSQATQTYADYGLHTDDVRLVRLPGNGPGEPSKVVRHVATPPVARLVTSVFGYVNIFPMLMRVLKPDSDKLGQIFSDLDKPGLLWTAYGLKSLARTSPLYMQPNTEHDPPYWRGQIWINMNYLTLAALRHYGGLAGPYTERARELHSRLRANVVRNVLSEYKRTGYLWEQYSAEDGKGSGCRPFTGWTALVTLIMAEEY